MAEVKDKYSSIFERMEGYYYYRNWKAEKENKIHIHSCGNAQYGSGTTRVKEAGKNGVWIGAFKTKELAQEKIKFLFGINAEYCNCCYSKK